jgi:hypothetical protein
MEPGKDISKVAKDELLSSLEDGAPGLVGTLRVYGNPSGCAILRELADMKASILEAAIREQHLRQDFKDYSIGYRRIRSRFLAKFPQSPLWGTWRRKRWDRIVNQGNEAAHDGDAVTDAKICKTYPNGDKIMRTVYGLSIKQVLELRKY